MRLFGLDAKDYISKQIRYSIGNVPSIPLGLFILYGLTEWGHLWYIASSVVSWAVSTGINYNVQKLLKVIVTKTDYLSKMTRFYLGSMPLVPLGTGVLYALTQYLGIWYLASSVLSMIATTISGMAIQMALKVVKVKRVDALNTRS